MMKRRKRYLESGGALGDIPKTTKYRIMNDAPCDPPVTAAPNTDSAPQRTSPADSRLLPSGATMPQVTGAPDIGSVPEASVSPVDTQLQDPSAAAVPLFGSPPAHDFGVPGESQTDLQAPPSPTETVPSSTAYETGPVHSDDLPEAPRTDESDTSANALSPHDLLALTLNFAIEFGLPWKGVEALQKLIAHILDRQDVPRTKYLFKKHVGAGVEAARFHFYCAECMTTVQETSGNLAERNSVQGCCAVCGNSYSGKKMLQDGHFFLTLPLELQLNSLLADQAISEALLSRLEKISEDGTEGMSDLTDGRLYREVRGKLSEHDLTLTLNVDGAPIFRSSKYAIWPIQVVINELPAHLRSRNILMPALWYGQSHADMTLFMQAFVEQMRQLQQIGFAWKVGQQTIHTKVYCLSCCADSPARALLQNMVQFNGHYGCGWCLHPGETIDGTIKYPVGATVQERTDSATREQMADAAISGTVIAGVKGPSPLINLKHFDIIWGLTPDYMHCVLLGVARQFTEVWLKDVHEPYYIGAPQMFDLLDGRLLMLKPPQCFSRLQRSLSVRKFWKATEWQQWLLYFALPCLQGILPTQYLKHFALLVQGICFLLKDTVTVTDVTESTHCLIKFVVDTQFLYSKRQMTFNVHQLMHLPKSAMLQGPLWAHSCFAFEANMGCLKELVTSAKGVPLQIVERLLMISNSKSLIALASAQTRSFLSNASKMSSRNAVLLHGKPREVSESVLTFVRTNIGNIVNGPVLEHSRALVSGYMLHSEQHCRPNKTDSTALMTSAGLPIKVEHIVSFVDKADKIRVFAVSKEYSVLPALMNTHIIRVQPQMQKVLVEVTADILPCIFMDLGNKMYFAKVVRKVISATC